MIREKLARIFGRKVVGYDYSAERDKLVICEAREFMGVIHIQRFREL